MMTARVSFGSLVFKTTFCLIDLDSSDLVHEHKTKCIGTATPTFRRSQWDTATPIIIHWKGRRSTLLVCRPATTLSPSTRTRRSIGSSSTTPTTVREGHAARHYPVPTDV